MSPTRTASTLDGVALAAWRSYLQSHAAILRELDAELVSEHGITTRDYEALLYLAQAEERKLPMHELAERTMLTRSGITRLVDGLVGAGFVQRISCAKDGRVSYAQLTADGHRTLRSAGRSHIAQIDRLFLARFSETELERLAELLHRLPGAAPDGSGCAVEATGCAAS